MSMAKKNTAQRAPRLGRREWIEAARATLIERGVAHVRVEPMAAKLGVTTGSFYWHFNGRDALLEALLADWAQTNTEGFARAVSDERASGEEQFAAVIDLWVNERGFSPPYDAAVRDWARVDETVRAAVRKADQKRIALLKSIFLKLGYDNDRAEVRARIMYYHQIGHYTLGLHDPPAVNLRYRPLYIEALRDGTGRGTRAKRS